MPPDDFPLPQHVLLIPPGVRSLGFYGLGLFFLGGGVISSFTLCGSAATVQPSELCLSSERGTPVAARGKPFPTEIGNF